MAVHAHPDDEVVSTGGVLARYADEGVETILVICTNGERHRGRRQDPGRRPRQDRGGRHVANPRRNRQGRGPKRDPR